MVVFVLCPFGHLRINFQFHVPVFIHVQGRFPEIHLLGVLRDGVPNRPPPPPLDRGVEHSTDPRGEPLPSNQSAFPAGGPSPS